MADAAPRGPDILIRTAPPLSATSDAPLAAIPKPPESASNDPADIESGVSAEMSPEAQAAATKAKTDPGADTGKDDTQAPKTDKADATADEDPADEVESIKVDGRDVPLPRWMKREITKARNRQREAEARAKTDSEALAALRAEVEALKAGQTKPASTEETAKAAPEPDATPAEPRPTRADFDDPDSYDEALTAWAQREGERKAAAALEAERRAEAEAEAKEAQESQDRALNEVWEARKAEAEARYPDYKEVAEADNLPISPTMAGAIVSATNGPDVAYWLGRNPDEAARIAALGNPMQQVFAVAEIAARLKQPAARPAPRQRPLDTLDTGGAGRAIDTSREPSMEEVAQRVSARMAAQRRPFLAATPTG